jgi:hypothetical protein
MPALSPDDQEVLMLFMSCEGQFEWTAAGMAGMVRTALPADRIRERAAQMGVLVDDYVARKMDIAARFIRNLDVKRLVEQAERAKNG